MRDSESSITKLKDLSCYIHDIEQVNEEDTEQNLSLAAELGSALLANNELLEEEQIRLNQSLFLKNKIIEELETENVTLKDELEACKLMIVDLNEQIKKEEKLRREQQTIFEQQDEELGAQLILYKRDNDKMKEEISKVKRSQRNPQDNHVIPKILVNSGTQTKESYVNKTNKIEELDLKNILDENQNLRSIVEILQREIDNMSSVPPQCLRCFPPLQNKDYRSFPKRKGHIPSREASKQLTRREMVVTVPCENRYSILDAVEEDIRRDKEEDERNTRPHCRPHKQRSGTKRKKGQFFQEENTLKQKGAKSGKDQRNKILILGDSHARGLAEGIGDRLGSKFRVVSIVKPNARFDDVVIDVEKLCSSYNENDYVVIIGGTNNFNHNRINNIKFNLDKISRMADRTNIVMPGIPLRYDKEGFGVNNLILECNRQLFKEIEYLKKENKKFVNIPKQKFTLKDHTSHGLHLNRHGKMKLSKQIASSITGHMRLVTPFYPAHNTQHTPIQIRNTTPLAHTMEYSHSTPTQSAYFHTQDHSLLSGPQHIHELSGEQEQTMSSLNSGIKTASVMA